MSDEKPVPQQVWDFRIGGLHNLLCVDVPQQLLGPYGLHWSKELFREFWVVQYDEWRDDGWNVGLAHQRRSLGMTTPVLLVIPVSSVRDMADIVEGTPCMLCKHEVADRGTLFCRKGHHVPRPSRSSCEGFKEWWTK